MRILIEDGELVLVDYKTDKCTNGTGQNIWWNFIIAQLEDYSAGTGAYAEQKRKRKIYLFLLPWERQLLL